VRTRPCHPQKSTAAHNICNAATAATLSANSICWSVGSQRHHRHLCATSQRLSAPPTPGAGPPQCAACVFAAALSARRTGWQQQQQQQQSARLRLRATMASWRLALPGHSPNTAEAVHFLLTSPAQRSTAQHSAAQRSTAQHSAAQHSAAQHSAAQRSTAQRSAAQRSAAQRSAAQRSTAQRSAAQRSMLLTARNSCQAHPPLTAFRSICPRGPGPDPPRPDATGASDTCTRSG
jgi:hypothetical protein